MNAAQLAIEADLERPKVYVDRRGTYMLVTVHGHFAEWAASLGPREQRLVAAGIRHVIDARALGGMTVTVELADQGTAWVGFAARFVAAVMISADAKSLVLALLDRAGRPLTAVRLDQAATEKLCGDDR
jgi:hypothetical protein